MILIDFFLSPLTDLSTGLLTFAKFEHKDGTDAKVPISATLFIHITIKNLSIQKEVFWI